MIAVLQLTCILAEIGACLSWWRWRAGDRRPVLIVWAALLAAIAGAAVACLCSASDPRFLVTAFGCYLLAGVAWLAMTGRGPARWDGGERTVLAAGVLATMAGVR